MAYEPAIGRPDLPRSFDDGGPVDLNNVTADGLVSVLHWDRAIARCRPADPVAAATAVITGRHMASLRPCGASSG
ncbi:hypothetical protein [Jiangella alba]|uniref:hypothetical protein n=1 Tax=Jiangella alba TaxID=561176 RepID=UPI00083EA668|nr:hypothetical protein [Jiangella alba]